MSQGGMQQRLRSRTLHGGTVSSPEPPWLKDLGSQSKRWHLFGQQYVHLPDCSISVREGLGWSDEQHGLQKQASGRT
jgi:hypothetical protein